MPFDAFFIRHGESVSNAGLATDDPATVALTEMGRHQAEALAGSISIVPAVIACSPFQRARETAEPLLARFPSAISLTLPIQEFTYLEPGLWRGSTATQRRPAVDEYWHGADPHSCAGAGAESFAGFFARVEAALNWLQCQTAQPVFLVCHELFIRAVLWRCLSPSLEHAISTMRHFRSWQLATPFSNTSVTKVSCSVAGETTISPPFKLSSQLWPSLDA